MITTLPSFFHPFISVHSTACPSCFLSLSCSVCSVLGIHLTFPYIIPAFVHPLIAIGGVPFIFLGYSRPRTAPRNPNGSRSRLLSLRTTNNHSSPQGAKYSRMLPALIPRKPRTYPVGPQYHRPCPSTHLPLKAHPHFHL